MINSDMPAITTLEMQESDAPVLVAMVTHDGLNNLSSGISHDTSVSLDDGGLTRIAFVLVLSFISLVTISRRASQN